MHLEISLPSSPNVEVHKVYKILETFLTRDSQHCSGGGGRSRVSCVLRIKFVIVPNVSAAIVASNY